ncbi:L-2-hydroxyglutarate oxidase [Nocardioides sp. SLBN-35]|uniref:L-2-hydroxyglutarate oxidase n=1 Tax=Nocardioides sp. SLBN-35 TaxID=2768445 RepID=UPI001154415D|nr:L-2-hydroxyglutarate oxidase [Nocardioides sp. SLBN-35]TQK72247.1 L-2-hydroxyglutarate oxidase [Nocardioides sp. SLBN-35]
MNRFDYVVVGGGIVGAATARALTERFPGRSVLLLDKEDGFGRHQTGHNSGVIHSGIYYAPGSLKAELCRAGAAATERFAEEHGVPWDRIGKLLVATTPAELAGMQALAERAEVNQISAAVLSAAELREREPHIVGLGALHLTTTGITDYRQINTALAGLVEKAGGTLMTRTALTGVRETGREVVLSTTAGEVVADYVVYCAGIQADRVAAMAGIDVDFAMIPFRGEYYDVRPERADLARTLIYPIPDPDLPFLGVHLTPTVDGGLNVGPNAVLGLAREGYPKFSFDRRDAADIVRFPGIWHVARNNVRTGAREMWNSVSKRGYLKLCQKYCPDLRLEDLTPREAGIRAQAVMRDGSFVHDFLLRQTARGLHVVNAPSPAATSALPIADEIVQRVAQAQGA